MLEEDEDLHTSCCSTRKSQIACAALPSSSTVTEFARVGGAAEPEHTRARPGVARLARIEPEIRERQHLERLLLRAHHPLQRRVARLVDRVTHRDQRRHPRFDHVVAELGLPHDPHRLTVDRELRGLRHERDAQPVGDRGPEHRTTTVTRLLAEQHEVGALTREHRGQHPARRDQIGPHRGRVAHQHRTIGTHRQRGPQRLGRRLRAHRDDDHLGARSLLQAQRRLRSRSGRRR